MAGPFMRNRRASALCFVPVAVAACAGTDVVSDADVRVAEELWVYLERRKTRTVMEDYACIRDYALIHSKPELIPYIEAGETAYAELVRTVDGVRRRQNSLDELPTLMARQDAQYSRLSEELSYTDFGRREEFVGCIESLGLTSRALPRLYDYLVDPPDDVRGLYDLR